MAISYVNDLRLSEMATGDNSGTWGTVTNTNLSLIGDAMGYGTRAIANASTDNITIADGTAEADRAMYLKLTGGGQACTVTLLPNTVSKVWMMENGTNSALTFTQGSGANVVIPAGDTKIIASDGGGSDAIVYDVFASLSTGVLNVTGDITTTTQIAIGQTATNAAIDIAAASKGAWTTGNQYTYPTGNAYISIAGTAAEHNWIGIAGAYGATAGSANLMLQANVNNTSQQAGHFIGSKAQATADADLMVGKLVGGSSTGARATETTQMRISNDGEVTFSAEDPANAAFNTFNSSAQTVNNYKGTTDGSAFTASSSNATTAIAAENAKGQIGTVTNHPLEILTNSAVRMQISTDGYVTQNNLPFLFGRGGDNLSVRTIPNNGKFFDTNVGSQQALIISGSAVLVGAGSHGITYASSTGRFTVPVAGKYYIEFRVKYSSEDDATVSVQILTNNNSALSYYALPATGPHNMTVCGAANLAANDFIELMNNSGGDRPFYNADAHCGVSIYLIG